MGTVGIDIGGRVHVVARCREGQARADRSVLKITQSRAGFNALDVWLGAHQFDLLERQIEGADRHVESLLDGETARRPRRPVHQAPIRSRAGPTGKSGVGGAIRGGSRLSWLVSAPDSRSARA